MEVEEQEEEEEEQEEEEEEQEEEERGSAAEDADFNRRLSNYILKLCKGNKMNSGGKTFGGFRQIIQKREKPKLVWNRT